MSGRHGVSRNVAIGLGLLCIVLFLGLGGLANYYAPDHSRVVSLQNQVDLLTRIVELQESALWTNATRTSQEAGQASIADYEAKYAGYILVIVTSSTANTTIQVSYNSYGVYYINRADIGTNGQAVFPILPGPVRVWVGNTNSLEPAIEVVTIWYYY